jgi:hypothetical protein
MAIRLSKFDTLDGPIGAAGRFRNDAFDNNSYQAAALRAACSGRFG